MAISLLSNPTALSVQNDLYQTQQGLGERMQRVASGKQIIHAGDDPAGNAIATKRDVEVSAAGQARKNAMDATSLTQVAEGGMNEVSNLLVRMRELATQAASDTVGDEERQLINAEVGQLTQEIDRIAGSTRFGSTHLLNGSGKNMTFLIGTDTSDLSMLHYDASSVDVRSSALGVDGISVENIDDAQDSLGKIDQAFAKLNIPRAQLGGLQARLHSVDNTLSSYEQNMTEANSHIRDADIAHEAVEITRTQIQQRAALSMLAQANMGPEGALKLLGT